MKFEQKERGIEGASGWLDFLNACQRERERGIKGFFDQDLKQVQSHPLIS